MTAHDASEREQRDDGSKPQRLNPYWETFAAPWGGLRKILVFGRPYMGPSSKFLRCGGLGQIRVKGPKPQTLNKGLGQGRGVCVCLKDTQK